MDHNKECDHSQCTHTTSSVSQTISEMDWERGLWHAAFYGDEEGVTKLINKAKNAKELVNTPDNAGYTPLHYAARKGYVHLCNLLLRYGAHIDTQTKSGHATPLHKAAAAGQLESIKFLLQCGAQIDKQDADGQTIIHKAAENKHFDLVNYLIHEYPEIATIKDYKGRHATDYIKGRPNIQDVLIMNKAKQTVKKKSFAGEIEKNISKTLKVINKGKIWYPAAAKDHTYQKRT